MFSFDITVALGELHVTFIMIRCDIQWGIQMVRDYPVIDVYVTQYSTP